MFFRPDRWLYGLPALVLIWVVAMQWAEPRIERDLRRDLTEPQPSADSSPRARIVVTGRDVVVFVDPGVDAAASAAAEGRARAVSGVRSVRTEVASAVPMSPFQLTIERGPGGIVLSGGVPSAALRSALVAEASAIAGGAAVDDQMKAATGEPEGFEAAARFLLAALAYVSVGEATAVDRALAFKGEAGDTAGYAAALAALRAPPAGYTLQAPDVLPPRLDPYRWSAARGADGIVLDGAVPSEALRAEVVGRARARFPDTAVEDRMETYRGLDPAIPFGALAQSALDALAKLDAGEVELSGLRLTLEGQGVARNLLADLDAELRRSLPSRVELAPLSIRVVPASPFTFAARRSGSRVVLSGYVPDEAERRAARELATSRFIGDTVVDELRLADGAPPRFGDAVRLGLVHLSELAEGSAVLRDAALRLEGRSLYRQAAERTRQTLPASVPAGWTAAVAIRAEPVERPLEASLCADLLADSLRRNPIPFAAGETAPAQAAGAGLDAAAAILRRCGSSRVQVVHSLTSPKPDVAEIAQQRAAAVAKALAERVPDTRLAANGSGRAPPGEPAAGGAAETATTEFVVTP